MLSNEELSALTSELDRIASTTQFNKSELLDGKFTSKNLQVGANSDQKISISIGEMNSKALGLHNISGTTTQSQTGQKVTGFAFGKYATTATDSTAAYSKQVNEAAVSLKAAVEAAKTEAGYMKQLNLNTGSAYYLDATNGRYATAKSAMEMDASAIKGTISDVFITNTNKAATYANVQNVIADKMTVGQVTTLTDQVLRIMPVQMLQLMQYRKLSIQFHLRDQLLVHYRTD